MAQGDSRQLISRTSDEDALTVSAASTDEIRQDIEASRRQIAQSLHQLRSEVSTSVERALDWRQWVHDHPQAAVGIAFGVGLYFGLR